MTVLTTHVGSLPRPKNVSDLLFKRENNESKTRQNMFPTRSKYGPKHGLKNPTLHGHTS